MWLRGKKKTFKKPYENINIKVQWRNSQASTYYETQTGWHFGRINKSIIQIFMLKLLMFGLITLPGKFNLYANIDG